MRHLPPKLAEAVAAHRRTHPPSTPEQRPAVRGDLAIVSHEHVTRIVCVTEDAGTHLVGVLCSNEVWAATDHDVILRREGTYDLLLEAEMRLVFLQAQVSGIVGTVDLDVVNAVRESLFTDGESVESFFSHPGYDVGLPLGGIFDPRRYFLEDELEDAVVLRDPAHKVIFDDGWNPGHS